MGVRLVHLVHDEQRPTVRPDASHRQAGDEECRPTPEATGKDGTALFRLHVCDAQPVHDEASEVTVVPSSVEVGRRDV